VWVDVCDQGTFGGTELELKEVEVEYVWVDVCDQGTFGGTELELKGIEVEYVWVEKVDVFDDEVFGGTEDVESVQLVLDSVVCVIVVYEVGVLGGIEETGVDEIGVLGGTVAV